ncbi:ABC transporter substrate-binding protein [Aliidongia dinghuensis]|uniref:ABC transporter substrate-binding protein n=1 Tax=Aliidongia dinghuensis TaxID=1867774 RepID=A0A8J3E1M6_9PROT|nr:DUF2076 domain-containing protein [Aliidongia dinghuensis]GGF01185.1 ABC transporter substrate-binding protein [Aliidongia dinghuensis]
MTPEERQLLTALADRVRNTPVQQKDEEAAALIRDLVQARPDTPYILAQTTLMQDFALRTAQAQIADLQRQLTEAKQAAPATGGGSFLGGLFGTSSQSVPPSGPWVRPQAQAYAQPQPAYTQPVYAAPVLQPSQTSGFLQSAAQTALGVAGGMMLFEGMESLFSGHHGGWGGGPWGGGPWGGGGGYGPTENITEIVNNNYYDTPSSGAEPRSADYSPDPGYQDASFDDGSDPGSDLGGDFGSDDDQSI